MSTHVKRLIALLSIPLLVLLSGCVRLHADYEVISEDEIKISLNTGFLNSAAEESEFGDMGGTDLCADAMTDAPNGVTAEPYEEEGDDGYTGCTVSGTVPLSELTDEEAGGFSFKDNVWTFTMVSGDTEMAGTDADMLSDFRVSVKFPGEVISYSGSPTVEGTTVTWTDPKDFLAAEGLTATAKNTASTPWLYIALGAIALLAIAALVFFLLRKKNTPPPQTGSPWQGGSPGPQQPYPPQGPGPQGSFPQQPYPPQGPGPQGSFPQQPYPPQGPGPQGPGPQQPRG